jgi:hypothetical protein
MKFIDIINESLSGFINLYTPEEKERLYKKARTIYKVFKKGKVTRSDGVTFSYELGDFMRPRIDEDGNLELFASVQTITELTWCAINHGFMTELIEQKFKRMFGIKIELTPPHESNLIKWTGKKPWDKEEPIELNENLDKERKKVKSVHKAIRKGMVNVDGNSFRYELPEDYDLFAVETGLISINFPFYNEDILGENGGLGIPLKVWRMEDGKDVSVNEILSFEDVSNICYGDEYLINTKSGLDYVNVRRKVKNRYRNFYINALMTTPNDEPIELNESFEDGAKNKKARIMFKLLKNGVIGSENEPNKPMFRYELSDNMAISRTDNLEDVVIYTAKMKIVELNRECRRVSPSTMAAEVRKRFEKEGIYLKYPPVEKNDVDSHLEREMRSSGMLNEGKRYTEDDITDNDHKKVKIIHKILKTGKIKSKDDNITYRYILPDDYWLSINYETGNIIVVLAVNSNQRLVLYSKFDESPNENPVDMEYNAIYRYVENEIKKLYLIYDIEIVFDGYISR